MAVLFSILCLYLFARLHVSTAQLPSVTITGDTLVEAGHQEARLTCSYTKEGRFQTLLILRWNKGETFEDSDLIVQTTVNNGPQYPVYGNTTLFPPERFMMTTDELVEGSSELIIKSVNRFDEGEYNCEAVYREDIGPDPFYGDMFLTVNVIPSSVVFEVDSAELGSLFEVVSGASYTFQCKAYAAYPAAVHHWRLGGVEIGNGVQRNETNSNDNSLWDSISSEMVTPQWPDSHDDILQCKAVVPVDPDGETVDVQLDVKVPPIPEGVTISDSSGSYSDSSTAEVNENQHHTFTCDVLNTRPSADITWQVDGSVPSQDFDVVSPSMPPLTDRLFDSSSTITFNPQRRHHKNTLQCTASIDVNNAQDVDKFLTLNVNGPPDTPVITPKTSFNEKDQITLMCVAKNAFPEGQISWFIDIDNKTVNPASNDLDTSDQRFDIKSTFDFTPMRADNRKILKCDVLHQMQTLTDQHQLNVFFCPTEVTITNCPTSLQVGSTYTFACTSSSSNPASTIQWFVNDNEKSTTHEPSLSDGEYNGKTTRLEYTTDELTKTDFGSEIVCRVTHPSIACTPVIESIPCALTVQYPAQIIGTPELIPSPPVNESQDISLTCAASGNPQPNEFVYWSKQGSTKRLGVYGDGTSILAFTGISRVDAGYYQCVADNGVGTTDHSSIFELPVHYEANITSKERNYVGVNEGSNAAIDCFVDGLPAPKITWHHPDESVLSNDTDRVTIVNAIQSGDHVNGYTVKSQLQITTVQTEDYGFYRCSIYNGIGSQDTLTIELNGTRKPEQVRQLRVVETTVSRISVQWSPGHDGGAQQSFLLDYRIQTNGSYTNPINIPAAVTSYIITNLLEYTDYVIRVRSSNINGISKERTVTERTKWLPKSPTDFVVASSTVDYIKLRWQPGDNKETTQWFLVEKRLLPNEEFVVELDTSDKYQLNEYHVTGLESGESYEFKLYSESEYGQSKYFQLAKGTTKAVEAGKEAIIAGTMGAVILLLFMAIVILLIVIYRLRKTKTPEREIVLGKTAELEGTFGSTKEGIVNHEVAVETSFHTQLNESSYGNTLCAKDFILRRCNIRIERELGHGEFGKVMKANAKEIKQGKEMTTVAVKTLKDNANDEAKQLLRKEFEIMKLLMVAIRDNMNPNIVILYGGCMEKDPLYVVLEYMPKGDLKSLLRESRVSKHGTDKTYDNLAVGSKSLTPVQLIRFALDVANGMAFLAAQKCIHRDLAARNVLLNEKYECKVSDFGLAQDVMDIEVYQRTYQCKLPIRWMAIESLDDKVHTLESDVWAYGVLLWEIITLGARPYPRMKAGEIRQMLRTGYRMPKPSHCNEQLYGIMLACWDKDPSKRPSYQQIMRLLEEVIEGQMGYLTLADFESKLYEDTTIAAADEKV